jgi:hypothetical protein
MNRLLFITKKEIAMKLEMRVYDLDVRLEIDDNDNFDTLEVLQNVKNLLEELKVYDRVNLSVMTAPYEEDDFGEDDHEDEHSAQTSWPYPPGGVDSMGTPVVQFLEPQRLAA